jgi:hypothetical protein
MASQERAQAFVVEQLAQRDTMLFRPIGTSTEVDLAVRGRDGQYVEVQVRSAEPGSRTFALARLRDRPNLFIVGVVWDGEEPSESWVLPAHVYDRFADGAGNAPRRLDLDAPADEPLRERLAVYKDRWALIAEFSKFRSTVSDPTALRVHLAMGSGLASQP